jgi:S1-C subfamily serine protease/rhodanese-related sulfurtransferase
MIGRLLGAGCLGILLVAPTGARAFTVQEAILRAKPAVALVRAEIRAEVTINCGTGPVTVQPRPFVEVGTGWFVDGRGYLITNAHVVDPAHRRPAWVIHELKKKAIDDACVEPVLKARGLMPGQRPEIEEGIRREASERALGSAKLTPTSLIAVILPNGTKLPAEVRKFSPPVTLDARGQPVKDSGRDLALLQVAEGTYPALALTGRDVKLGDPVRILGFPAVVQMHELLSQGATLDASVTSGAVSGLDKQDAIGQDVIQTDAPAAHGTSGGPAIGADAAVVGVMTFLSLSPAGGGIVQGFNFLIPARDVKTFLAGTPVTKPGDSRFAEAWDAGLSALFSDRYAVAVARFTEANRLLGNLPDVKHALDEAAEKLKNPPPRPFPWVWTTLGVTVLSVGAYGAMLGRGWWRNRFRILPGQVVGLVEKGLSPVLLDVRSTSDFETSPLTLPGAVRLSPEDADAGRITLAVEPGQVIITYCTTPGERTSAQVAQILRKRGYRHVRILKGGLGGWTNARLPVEAKSHLPSIGIEIYKSLTLGDVERRRFEPEQVIFREGEEAHGEAYLIHTGAVEIRKRVDGALRVLRKFGEGELFGEMAFFREAPRSADAVATAPVELLVIGNERLEWLVRNRPQLAIELLKRLSDFVVQTDIDRGTASDG